MTGQIDSQVTPGIVEQTDSQVTPGKAGQICSQVTPGTVEQIYTQIVKVGTPGKARWIDSQVTSGIAGQLNRWFKATEDLRSERYLTSLIDLTVYLQTSLISNCF